MAMSPSLVSPHLSWKELACKDGTGYPQKYVLDGRVYRLAQVFENIRSACGDGKIIIHSAFRTPEWNKLKGGVDKSQHVEGLALDLEHNTLANSYFFDIISTNWRALGVRGLGYYKTFVHIDIRDSMKLTVWRNL